MDRTRKALIRILGCDRLYQKHRKNPAFCISYAVSAQLISDFVFAIKILPKSEIFEPQAIKDLQPGICWIWAGVSSNAALMPFYCSRLLLSVDICLVLVFTSPAKKSSAQVCVGVNSVLTRNGCIQCYVSLFKEIILQHLDAFQTDYLIFNLILLSKIFKFTIRSSVPHVERS